MSAANCAVRGPDAGRRGIGSAAHHGTLRGFFHANR